MRTSLWKSALLGGLTVFVWTAVSWMVLPWHARTLHAFDHDVDVIRMLDFGAGNSGIYIYPAGAAHKMAPGEPTAFVSYSKSGMRPMGTAMAFAFGEQCLGALILAWLLRQTTGLRYGQKVLFAASYGLAIGLLGNAPYWIWWAFPTDYTGIAIAESLMGWTLAGLVLGKVN